MVGFVVDGHILLYCKQYNIIVSMLDLYTCFVYSGTSHNGPSEIRTPSVVEFASCARAPPRLLNLLCIYKTVQSITSVEL